MNRTGVRHALLDKGAAARLLRAMHRAGAVPATRVSRR